MKRSWLLVSTLLLSVTLSACENKGFSMDKTNTASTQQDAAQGRIAHLNPNPTAGYRIRLKIENAPGPFEVVQVGGQFDVRNVDECGKIKPATGTPSRLTSMKSIPVSRVSENEYEGVIHFDKVMDEDYYGRGVCHWEMSHAYAYVAAADESIDTNFLIRLHSPEVLAGSSIKRFYTNLYYPRAELSAGLLRTGKASPEEYLPELRPAVFALILSSVGEAE